VRIDVRFRGLEPSHALREHASRKIQFHMSRFGEEVTSVQVRISDVNGPKGGLDKLCQLAVRGRRLPGDVLIEDLSADAYSAVDMAVERAGRAVGRNLERVRSPRVISAVRRKAS
jgi:putative sigma-54 modulation protein